MNSLFGKLILLIGVIILLVAFFGRVYIVFSGSWLLKGLGILVVLVGLSSFFGKSR